MPLTRIMKTGYSERWQETDPDQFDGGAAISIDTDIPSDKGILDPTGNSGLDYVNADLYLQPPFTGVPDPNVPDPTVTTYVDVNGRTKYRVQFQNNSAVGNKCGYELHVWLTHSWVR